MARALATALLATFLVSTACGGELQAQGESTRRKATEADRLHAAETNRLREAVERAGFSVLRQTGRWVVADCRGREFFIWSTGFAAGREIWVYAGSRTNAPPTCAAELAALRSGSPWGVRAERCPEEWPGPWTACPEAAWVGRVAERAGFRIVAETGSALVASGSGLSFHVWATEIDEPVARVAEREAWRPLGRREGVLVYGDRDLWRWWVAQGFVFWLKAGPYEDSQAPGLDGVVPLIRASTELPPPG